MSVTAFFRNSTEFPFECTSPDLELQVGPGDKGGVAFYGDELKFSFITKNGSKKTIRVIWNLLPGEREVEVQFQRGSGNISAVCHETTRMPEPFPVDTEIFPLCFLADADGIVIVGIDDLHPFRVALKPTAKARSRARNYHGRYNRLETQNKGHGRGRDDDDDDGDDDDDDKKTRNPR